MYVEGNGQNQSNTGAVQKRKKKIKKKRTVSQSPIEKILRGAESQKNLLDIENELDLEGGNDFDEAPRTIDERYEPTSDVV